MKGNPAGHALHTYRIAVDNAFVDQEIYIGSMRGHQGHKLLIHGEMYNCLKFFHYPVG